MAINFHDKKVSRSYLFRDAHETWIEEVKKIVKGLPLNQVVDIGCGGEIYSKALLDMGANSVIGIDYSIPILDMAKENNKSDSRLKFQLGTAEKTGIKTQSVDLVLERALIHHLSEYKSNFFEIYRILKEDGMLIIQDRTLEDCFLPGSRNHIRGYFFSRLPELREIEEKRRPSSEKINMELRSIGFKKIKEMKLWETRKIYESKEDFFQDLHLRRGRSILYDVSDHQLEDLTRYIQHQMQNHHGPIIEKDRWTIWIVQK